MTDITLTCIQCQEPFTFTEGEQQFYESKGFQQPKRCLKCRRLKKQGNPQEQTFGKPAYQSEQPIRRDFKRREKRRSFDEWPQEEY